MTGPEDAIRARPTSHNVVSPPQRQLAPLFARLSLGSVAFAPLLGQAARWWTPDSELSQGFTQGFGLQCHRTAARLLHPALDLVCARCWGFYAGFAIAALFGRRTASSRTLGWGFALGALITLLEWSAQQLGHMESHGLVRFVLGTWLSFCAASLMIKGVASRDSGAGPAAIKLPGE